LYICYLLKKVIEIKRNLKMKSKLIVVGAAGRMGQRILALATDSGQFDIIAAVERKDHPDIGKIALPTELKLCAAFLPKADLVIDFSQPESTETSLQYCLENNSALVLGTTGLSQHQHEMIQVASKKIPVIYATNMSVAMNVLFSLVGKVAQMLGENYDIEIIEQHHRFKKDSPSGSALTLARNICDATGRDFPGCIVHGRAGKDSLRRKGTVGMHAVRAGDITGIHSVIFATLGETLTLNHTANSPDTFAAGALHAAEWLVNQKSGLFSMKDCLGLA
jgi:4-hydroxy-tetrahydrodipicolinate reductase